MKIPSKSRKRDVRSFRDLLFLCPSPLCISRKKPTQFPFLYETDAYNLRPSQPCCILLLIPAKWRPNPFQTLFSWIYSHSEDTHQVYNMGLSAAIHCQMTLDPAISLDIYFLLLLCVREQKCLFVCLCVCVCVCVYIYIYIYIHSIYPK